MTNIGVVNTEKNQPKVSPGKKKKIETVAVLTEKLQKAKSFFFTDYRGLTHRQLEELRKILKEAKAEFIITKNTLMRLALLKTKKENREEIGKKLKEPTAVLFAYEEGVGPVKKLASFIKKYNLPKIKIGFLNQKVLESDDFKKLASLPTKDVLIGILAARMKTPIYKLHYALTWNMKRLVVVLNNVKTKKE